MVTQSELEAFAAHNRIEKHWCLQGEFTAPFIHEDGARSIHFIYNFYLTDEGKIVLYPGDDRAFGKELDGLKDLVSALRTACLIKTSLPT